MQDKKVWLIPKWPNKFTFSKKDEDRVVFIFSRELLKTAERVFKKPEVQLTALGLFRRCYFYRSLVQVNPTSAKNCTILLAAKLEELNPDPNVAFERLEIKEQKEIRRNTVTELKILEAVRFDLNFCPVYSLLDFLLKRLFKKYNVSVKFEEAFKLLKKIFCTEMYFTRNQVVICVFVVYKLSKGQLVESNFFLLFKEIGVEELEKEVKEMDKVFNGFEFFKEEELKESLNKYNKIKRIGLKLSNKPRGNQNKEFKKPESANLKKVKTSTG